ncbi:SRPBCC domain-containing protein [Bacillus salacetis]|uniref:SRPBCC domain-containing protein n=1 Tax=Bacillus salacetis TaxID=2315464 RepID=A0A3A1R9T4_9BACI|nr:SRPBCC domain-containing protein [Bacillus salacetis]RIW38514.1 SRPBCC domain-containing protein [Bacillus salacetis]
MDRISHRVFIKAEQRKVYETLTTAKGWDAWFTTGASLEFGHQGTGAITLRWEQPDGNMIEDVGRIIKADSPSFFSFYWKPGDSTTTVNLSLEPYKDGTIVHIEEEGYSSSPADQAALVNCASGWGEALMLLKMHLEYGIVCKNDLFL